MDNCNCWSFWHSNCVFNGSISCKIFIFFYSNEVIVYLVVLFILGIFIKRANWKGTLLGALLSVIVLVFVKYNNPLNFYIYPLIIILTCVLGGYFFSLIFTVEDKNIDDLVYSKTLKR